MNERAWSQSSDVFRPVSTISLNEKLLPGIYIPGQDMSGYYLTKYHKQYDFPYKIYGVNQRFIDRVNLTYQNTVGNLGVLLNGVKGTGKSVTAELICNKFIESGMPVILITSPIQGLPEFIASIDQDIVVFIDEYEKIYKDENGRSKSAEILTIMDGALKSSNRRLFLFTTNKKSVDENLLERPGRIRYVKEFNDLTRDVIEELVEDLLVHPERKQACINFISRLQTITIDIVKAVITEVNIHDEDPSAFSDVFNTFEITEKINIYDGRLTPLQLATALPRIAEIHGLNYDIMSATRDQLKNWAKHNVYLETINPYCDLGEFVSFENNVLTVRDGQTGSGEDVYVEYTIEVTKPFHRSYSKHLF